MKAPIDIVLDDPQLERLRLDTRDRIRELQALPRATSIINVSLADATTTPVPHGLGRKPIHVSISPPRGGSTAGWIGEVRDGTYDLTKFVVLVANGFGATITVDLMVW